MSGGRSIWITMRLAVAEAEAESGRCSHLFWVLLGCVGADWSTACSGRTAAAGEFGHVVVDFGRMRARGAAERVWRRTRRASMGRRRAQFDAGRDFAL
jgi:hypothetical protein